MKKFLFCTAVALAAISANAQKSPNYAGSSRFWDNWSIGLQAGSIQQIADVEMMKHPAAGVTLSADKYITPWFGVGLDARALFNTRTAPMNACHYTIVMGESVSGYAKFNLTNILLRYKGRRRIWEPVAYAGLGWMKYNTGNEAGVGSQMIFRSGLEMNFNMGRKRAWALVVNPSVAWGCLHGGKMSRRDAALELNIGFVYHFGTSNGTHDFKRAKLYNQAEVDSLNAVIARIEKEKAGVETNMAENAATIEALTTEVAALRARKPETITQTVTKTETRENLECYVYFNLGKRVVAPSQMPNVERIATFMKSHSTSRVTIRGYASPDGSAEINQKIANARANAIKTLLIEKYGIAAGRITAIGQGVGKSFSEPDWNRVSICTIEQ